MRQITFPLSTAPGRALWQHTGSRERWRGGERCAWGGARSQEVCFFQQQLCYPFTVIFWLAAINPRTAWLQCPSICGSSCRLSHLTISQYWWLSFNSKPGKSKLYEFFQITVFFPSPDLSVFWWSLTWPPNVLPAVIWPHLRLKHHSAMTKHNSGAIKAHFKGLPLSYLSFWYPAGLLEAENISRCVLVWLGAVSH